MKPALIIALMLIVFSLPAQKPPIKFGYISQEEIDLAYYAPDSSAVAVVLTDYGHAYINVASGKLMFERHTRIKILKKEGLNYASASIPLYHHGSTEETVSNLKGVTYNFENGKVVETKMSKNSVFFEKFNKNVNLQKFAFEEVKVGSIIEYSYKVYSDFFSNYPSWKFQTSIPVIWSEYRADIPEFFDYEKYMQGYLPLALYEANKKNQNQSIITAHRWIVKDAPAFNKEAYMACEEDYLSKINFALSHYNINGISYEIMGSWEKLREKLLKSEYFGEIVDHSAFLNKTVKELKQNVTDQKEIVKLVFEYVKQNLGWNGVSEFAANSIRDAFKEGKGSSADINLSLASMLKQADIEVDLVILSTRDHGFIRPQYSIARQFNYVICRVDIYGEKYFLDATDRNLSQELIPERCLNGSGLLISKTKGVEWIDLELRDKSKSIISSEFIMDENGELKGKFDISKSRYFARNMRESYESIGEVEYLKNFVSGKSWKISDSKFTALSEVHILVKEELSVEISDHTMMAGERAYITPIFLSKIDENPFKRIEREYPVDFGSPFENLYLSKITIPKNFVVDELPKSKIISLPENGGKYTYNMVSNGNTIYITSNFLINKSMFVQTEYPALREFYNQVVAMQSEQIVLKRVK